MATFFPLVNVSEPVQHALEVIGREISAQLGTMSTKEQNEFWNEVHGFALVTTRDKSPRTPLIAAQHVDDRVRSVLESLDQHIRTHTAELSPQDQKRFWEVLHEQAERLRSSHGSTPTGPHAT